MKLRRDLPTDPTNDYSRRREIATGITAILSGTAFIELLVGQDAHVPIEDSLLATPYFEVFAGTVVGATLSGVTAAVYCLKQRRLLANQDQYLQQAEVPSLNPPGSLVENLLYIKHLPQVYQPDSTFTEGSE